MPIYRTPDGRYTYAIETPGEGDGNSVVYDRDAPGGTPPLGLAVWDRKSHEAQMGSGVGNHLPAAPDPPAVVPLPGVPASDSAHALDRIQVTLAADGPFVNRGYSYWPQACRIGGDVVAFAGHADGHPRFYRVTIATGHVEALGACLDIFGYIGTGENLYWDAAAWLYLLQGSALHRASIFTGAIHTVLDIAQSHPGCDLWQPHSSVDGSTYSATVRQIVSDGPYPLLGTVVSYHGDQQFFPAHGELDESQITPDGGWLVIKETIDGLLTNRIITLGTRETRLLPNWGAVGHSDVGAGLLVGESSPQAPGSLPGACVAWDLTQPLTPERRRVLFQTDNMGHLALRGSVCIVSDAEAIYSVDLQTGARTRLANHGSVGTDYDHQVFANLSPEAEGSIVAYLSNGQLFLLVLRK